MKQPTAALSIYVSDVAARTGLPLPRARIAVDRHMPLARCSAQERFGAGATVASEAWRKHVLNYIVDRVKEGA